MSIPVYPRANFGAVPLVSACEISPEEFHPENNYGGGCAFVHHGFYGTFRNEKGEAYTVMTRRVGVLGATDITVFSNRGGRKKMEEVLEFREAFSGMTFFNKGDDSFSIQSWAIPPARTDKLFTASVTKEGSKWSEGGDLLSLEGKYVGNCALQWMTPNPSGSDLHIYHMQRASGTILGEKVEGFYDINTTYSAPGSSYFHTFAAKALSWVFFGNEYDDGTMEVGQICIAEGNWKFAMIANQDGPILMSTDFSVQGQADDEGYPGIARFTFADQQWEWRAAERCGIDRGIVNSPMQQGEGYIQRVGDSRKIVVGMAMNGAKVALPPL